MMAPLWPPRSEPSHWAEIMLRRKQIRNLFKLCSNKSAMFSSAQALSLMPKRTQMMGKGKGMRITCQAAIPADNIPDMGKRKLMNLLLLTNLTSLWFPMPLSLLYLALVLEVVVKLPRML